MSKANSSLPYFILRKEEETMELAASLAALLRTGDCVCLYGDLGVGKTCFARGVIEGLLIELEEVPSPTFTLIQTYETIKGSLWHCDFYRLKNADEALELGLEDAFSEAITLIEWPDRIGSYLPPHRLELHWTMSEDFEAVRQVRIVAKGDWQSRLKALKRTAIGKEPS